MRQLLEKHIYKAIYYAITKSDYKVIMYESELTAPATRLIKYSAEAEVSKQDVLHWPIQSVISLAG